MRKNFLYIAACFFSAASFCQTPVIDWQRSYGGSGLDRVRKCIPTMDGGFFLLCDSQSSDGDIAENNGEIDILMIKTDILGNIVWQEAIGGSSNDYAHSVLELPDGYVIAGGTYSNDGDVVGHQGINSDAWIVKVDLTGEIQWQNCLGTDDDEKAKSIISTTDGGFIVAGDLDRDIDPGSPVILSIEYWIVKLDSEGEIEWDKIYGGTDQEYAMDILQTIDGGYIVVGETASNDGDVLFNHSNSADIWVLKLDLTGEIEWQKSLGGTGFESPFKIVSVDGGFVIGGSAASNDGDVTDNNGYDDIWIIKISPSGEIIWEETFGGSGQDYCYSISEANDSGLIVAGQSNSNDVDTSGNHGNHDAWVMKLDADGGILWEKQFGGTQLETAFDAFQMSDDGIIVGGFSASADGDLQENQGGWDFWLFKIIEEILDVHQSEIENFEISPNPATSYLQFQLPYDFQIKNIKITDVTGKTILNREAIDQISIENISSGLYFIEVTSTNKIFLSKFIKQ